MKAFTIYTKTVSTLNDGRPCTPYFIKIRFHGNIFLSKNKSVFLKPWFNITSACFHILGFRFTKSIT